MPHWLAGHRVGPYEVVGLLGAGGMGEVYRARDARLGRDVAIKVSATPFTDRFAREARMIAALNHPNICTLYDVGPDHLVMELVEGPTLAERLAAGSLSVLEALPLIRQIADALHAAHERGIVHRDLKPANIKVNDDGVLKVLDFGLGKVSTESEASPTLAASPDESPTTMANPTEIGSIMGSAAYLAPEQAKGKPVDKRADIWSFGVIVWEMLTGRRLFEGAVPHGAARAGFKQRW